MLQHHFLSPVKQSIVSSVIRGFELPTAYLTLLEDEGAGYFFKSSISTTEPTRYGLDFALLNGIFGFMGNLLLDTITSSRFSPDITHLPEYFVPFFQDDAVYFCFDYKDNATAPSIRLVDTEMDQWLKIADSFDSLLTSLQSHVESVDYEHRQWVTLQTIIQQLGTYSPDNFFNLIEILEESNLSLALHWLSEAIQYSPILEQEAREKLLFLDEFRHEEISQLDNYPILIKSCKK